VPQLSPTLALAARHAATTHGSTGAQSVSASSLLIQMVVGLIVIVFLIKMASKFVQGRGGRTGRTLGHGPRAQGVSVVGRQSLGKGVQVAMVAAGKQTFLLGVTQRQVTLLGEVETDGPAPQAGDAAVGGLQLLRGGSRPALGAGGSRPTLKSALEQMRDRTARRA
jgi:flagellar biogenesis protein FliO